MSGVTPFFGAPMVAPDAPAARVSDAAMAADFSASLVSARAALGSATTSSSAASVPSQQATTAAPSAAQAALLRALVVTGTIRAPLAAAASLSSPDTSAAAAVVADSAAAQSAPDSTALPANVLNTPMPAVSVAEAPVSNVEPLPETGEPAVAVSIPAAALPSPAETDMAACVTVSDDADGETSEPRTDRESATLPNIVGESSPPVSPLPPIASVAPAPVVVAAPPEQLSDDHADITSAQRNSPAEGVAGKKGPTLRRDVMRNDLASLTPEFRQRLERVIDRLERQYGHSVRILETHRSQERQDALFAQGRTTDGQVVTWTRTSRHTRGMAADLLLDGRWDNADGYAHLAEAAAAEGLRTLGPRDPGHVELVTGAPISGDTVRTLLSEHPEVREFTATDSTAADARAQSAALARVADVVQVARVARVAEVARVAGPGISTDRQDATAAMVHGAPDTLATDRPEVSAAIAPASDPVQHTVSPLAGAAPSTAATSFERVIATAPQQAASVERIAQLLDLQATTAARPLQSMMLRMDSGSGLEDRIRVDLRGTTVDAQLGLGSTQQAAAATDRINELRAALERHGLTTDSVRVQAPTGVRAADSAEFSRAALAAPVLELAAARAGADANTGSSARDQQRAQDQQASAQQRDAHRSPTRAFQDDPRHRARRDAQEQQP